MRQMDPEVIVEAAVAECQEKGNALLTQAHGTPEKGRHFRFGFYALLACQGDRNLRRGGERRGSEEAGSEAYLRQASAAPVEKRS